MRFPLVMIQLCFFFSNVKRVVPLSDFSKKVKRRLEHLNFKDSRVGFLELVFRSILIAPAIKSAALHCAR